VLGAIDLVPGSRRIVAIGDMLELGRYSMNEHERIGTLVAKYADMIVTVGHRSEALRAAAIRAGINESQALGFATSIEAAHALEEHIQEGDVVLIKGSQGMRMERIVEALLKNPADSHLLVRQDKEWKRR
jgi:UDP-N-acetylmuramoyl-tripeptide--D-alanyl-D-alanine ligase